MSDIPPYPGTPRWVKVFGTILIALVLSVLLLKIAGIGGRHGPGRRLPSSNAVGEPVVPSGVTEDHGTRERDH